LRKLGSREGHPMRTKKLGESGKVLTVSREPAYNGGGQGRGSLMFVECGREK